MISPGEFDPELHYYDKVQGKTIHPEVVEFLSYTTENLIDKYTTNNKMIDKQVLEQLLNYKPKHFNWAGADLYKTDRNKMIVLETNSCPSGQKSMPERNPGHGYELLMRRFLEISKVKTDIVGSLAVIYDKNVMEVSGYAKQLANIAGEAVYYIEIKDKENTHIKWEDGILYVLSNNSYIPIRAAFRYVTQKPWTKIPIKTKTYIFNPIIACLAGGRNKLVANKAYDLFNSEYKDAHIQISKPKTLTDIELHTIAEHVKTMNYHAVIKNPYSNAGQGVYIIRNEMELHDFIIEANKNTYKKYIIQELITPECTATDLSGNRYVYDMRFMIYFNGLNYRPIVMCARKARSPFNINNINSRDIYLTNLSEKNVNGWTTQSERLITFDEHEYKLLNLNIDNLVDAYFQSVFVTVAIDKMADMLYKDDLNVELFKKLNDEPTLATEFI